MDMLAPPVEINAAFCSRESEREKERGANSRPQLPDVWLADLDEHLMMRHPAGQVINLFRQ